MARRKIEEAGYSPFLSGASPENETHDVTLPAGVPPFGIPGEVVIRERVIRYFDTRPEGADDTLIFIHGYSGCGYECKYLAEHISRDIRILAPDLPGMGFSEKPVDPFSLDLFISVIKALHDTLAPGKITLVGHSLGGAVAATYTMRYPDEVKDLILLAPYGLSGEQGSLLQFLSRFTPLVDFAASVVNRRIFRMILETRVFHDPGKIPSALENYLAESFLTRGGSSAIGALTKDVMNSTVIDSILPEIHRFVLIIWGTDDKVLSYSWAEAFQHLLPFSQLIPAPKCGHMPHVEQVELTAQAIQDFMTRKSLKRSSNEQ